MTSQPGQQTIAIHILPNISRCRNNQIMKFGQLIECNMRIIFLEKTYTKCGGETIPRRFSKELKLTISLDLQCNVLYILFLFYAKLRDIKNIETKQQTACIYLIQSIFIKQKEIWN